MVPLMFWQRGWSGAEEELLHHLARLSRQLTLPRRRQVKSLLEEVVRGSSIHREELLGFLFFLGKRESH